nr:hypothetical protein [Kibdelosporangium sp. MJ126-NF4]CTQ98050.1 hypothetical protein [Kibdelosporangium sp. MJ126-NF4]
MPRERLSDVAMSVGFLPSAAIRSTSTSRLVSGHSVPPHAATARSPSTTRLPAATPRTALASSSAGASLSRKPLTLADSARRSVPGLPRLVRIRVRQAGTRWWISPAAERPSLRGRSMSITATSGRVRNAAGRISSPAATSATTSMSGSRLSSAASAPRIMCTSSANRTLIISYPIH